jgi:hypothetical protein
MHEDPEIPDLYREGIFSAIEEPTISNPDTNIPVPVLKKRLVMFLEVFAAVTSPKQLYLHKILYRLYGVILSKPDTVVAKLALNCILSYNDNDIIAYKDSLKNLLDDKKFRDELLLLNPSLSFVVEDTDAKKNIELKHRDKVVPLVLRIVYGRFVSHGKSGRKAKELGLARYY